MELFKSWILSICGATAITSLCKIVLSKSKSQKMVNVFLSIFVLLYTILPLDNINFSSSQKDFSNEDSFLLYYQEGYELIVSESILNLCEKNNVKVIDIEIDSYIDDEKNFIINNLTVDIEDNSKLLYVKELIMNLNYEVNVI